MDNSVAPERRGISWRDQTLASISAPPMPLMVIFGLVVLLLYFATYSHYKTQVARSLTGFKLSLFLLPVLLVLLVQLMIVGNRWFYNVRDSRLIRQEGSSPLWLVLVVLLLLVLVYYQSSIKSSWFHPV